MSFAFNLVDGGGLLGFRLRRAPDHVGTQAPGPAKPLRAARKCSSPMPLGAVRLGKGAVDAIHGRSASTYAKRVGAPENLSHTTGEYWRAGASAGSEICDDTFIIQDIEAQSGTVCECESLQLVERAVVTHYPSPMCSG